MKFEKVIISVDDCWMNESRVSKQQWPASVFKWGGNRCLLLPLNASPGQHRPCLPVKGKSRLDPTHGHTQVHRVKRNRGDSFGHFQNRDLQLEVIRTRVRFTQNRTDWGWRVHSIVDRRLPREIKAQERNEHLTPPPGLNAGKLWSLFMFPAIFDKHYHINICWSGFCHISIRTEDLWKNSGPLQGPTKLFYLPSSTGTGLVIYKDTGNDITKHFLYLQRFI